MEQFVDYLSEMKDLSPPIEKLHKLCIPFIHLTTNMLESTESRVPSENYKTTAPMSSIEQSQTTILETNIFPAVPTPLPRLSVSDQMPITPDSVMQDSNIPSSFPTFTSAPADDACWQLMDAQPRLQWLDSDFSGLERTWSDSGFGYQEFLG